MKYRRYHIRLYHLVIGWHTLECNIWFWNDLHMNATLHMLNHIIVLQSNVVHFKTKCCTLMCANQWANDTISCGTPYYFEISDLLWVHSVMNKSGIYSQAKPNIFDNAKINKDSHCFNHRMVHMDKIWFCFNAAVIPGI